MWADKLRKEETMQNHNIDLTRVPTADLVAELQKREGVETTIAEPYQDVTASVNGPAIVLVVTD